VRHPIYAGLVLAVLATAAQRASPLAFTGAGILLVALLLWVWREERFLSEELGADAYAAYRVAGDRREMSTRAFNLSAALS
jgi:protein-S-isoprenylcysteine O-methyltransferase Ste14